MMNTRPCEFCAGWDEKYLEEHLTPDTVCGACNGSKVLDIKACFCCAWNRYECSCDAYWED